MKRIIAIIAAVLGLGLNSPAQISRYCVFTRGENEFHTYRIPAIVQAKDGTLLAFAEARKNGRGDSGDIDLVLKRSTDGGTKWSSIITVWDDGENVCGNPCPIVDRETGRIILLSTWNNGKDPESSIHQQKGIDSRRVFVLFSDDNGLTWTKPREITGQTKEEGWTWYATGPCHGIQLRSGRLVVPCNHGFLKDGKPAPTNSHIIYSDDKGETWHIGGCPNIGNESTVCELDNGDVVLNMRSAIKERKEWGYARIAAVSHDGGQTFDEPFYVKGLIEPVCNASITDYSPDGLRTGKILFSNPEHTSKRVNMTVRMSADGGTTWKRVCTLTEGPTAYSDLCVLSGGDVAALYEQGETMSYENIMFARIDKSLFEMAPDKVVKLYPEGQSSDKGIEENGVAVTGGPLESNCFDRDEEVNGYGNCSYVGDNARLEIYLPKAKPTGQMVVVCPGGGYSTVCARKEGEDVARWMSRRGIATCVVVYRLPGGHTCVPLADVQNAFRYCRAHAEEWGVNQIGVMGFSAGGHLAATASTMYADAQTRPDFSILIYPVIDLKHHNGTRENLVGSSKKLAKQYSLQHRVTSDTPRTYLGLSQNDNVVDIHSSIEYFDALTAAGVKAEMYVFPSGGHGYGFLNEEVGGRADKLGTYRPMFSATLEKFLENVRPPKKK